MLTSINLRFADVEVDVEKPVLTEADLSALDEINSVKGFVSYFGAFMLLSMIGFGALSMWSAKPDLPILFLVVSGLIFMAVYWVDARKRVSLYRLKRIEGEDCIELANLLQSSKSEVVQRYANSVREMGRQYRLAEFLALKDYAQKAAELAVVEDAKAVLYGHPPAIDADQ